MRAWIGDVALNNSYEYGKLPDIEGIGQSIASGNTIKELQAEKKWLRESSTSQGENTADFKKLDYDSTAVNMANFRKLDELLLVIDPVEEKDPYEGTQYYYYPEDYANIAIIDEFLKKLEITREEKNLQELSWQHYWLIIALSMDWKKPIIIGEKDLVSMGPTSHF